MPPPLLMVRAASAAVLLAFANTTRADDLFTYDAVFGQSSGGSYVPYPVGFFQSGSDIYATTLEILTSTHRSRRHLIGTGSSNLKTAESTPQLNPCHAHCMNLSGLVVGYAATDDSSSGGPVYWSSSTLSSDTNGTPLALGNFDNGEALMVNSSGWAVGYFGTSLSLGAVQEPFVNITGTNTTTVLLLPSGYDDGRATCINGKTNTPEDYRIGGWKRNSGGSMKPILWMKDGSDWDIETVYDPDGVLTGRNAWIADINDNGVCVGRIDGVDPTYYEEIEELGGLFIYDPTDKVRRISLNGLSSAIPVRINNNNEIAVNRNDGGVERPYIVFPPQQSGPIRGSVVDWSAVWDYFKAPLAVAKAVYEFKDDRRAVGYGTLNSIGNPRFAFVSRVDASTSTNEEPTDFTPENTFSSITGDIDSTKLLDGDYWQASFASNETPSIEIRATHGNSMDGYLFRPTIRATTGGSYSVTISYWDWTLNSGSGGWNSPQAFSFGTDFTSSIGTPITNSNYFYHNSAWDFRVKLTFSVTFPSATPTIQIERASFAIDE